jgi:hypothetical protein
MSPKALTVYKMSIVHKRLLDLEARLDKAFRNGASRKTVEGIEATVERLTDKFNELMLLSEKQNG